MSFTNGTNIYLLNQVLRFLTLSSQLFSFRISKKKAYIRKCIQVFCWWKMKVFFCKDFPTLLIFSFICPFLFIVKLHTVVWCMTVYTVIFDLFYTIVFNLLLFLTSLSILLFELVWVGGFWLAGMIYTNFIVTTLEILLKFSTNKIFKITIVSILWTWK